MVYTDFHGFKNTPNRFENRFYNSFMIRAHPCHPWFNFGFRISGSTKQGGLKNPGVETAQFTDKHPGGREYLLRYGKIANFPPWLSPGIRSRTIAACV